MRSAPSRCSAAPGRRVTTSAFPYYPAPDVRATPPCRSAPPVRESDFAKLPAERYGLVMVFRAFDRASYALVMQATRPVAVSDIIANPNRGPRARAAARALALGWRLSNRPRGAWLTLSLTQGLGDESFPAAARPRSAGRADLAAEARRTRARGSRAAAAISAHRPSSCAPSRPGSTMPRTASLRSAIRLIRRRCSTFRIRRRSST